MKAMLFTDLLDFESANFLHVNIFLNDFNVGGFEIATRRGICACLPVLGKLEWNACPSSRLETTNCPGQTLLFLKKE